MNGTQAPKVQSERLRRHLLKLLAVLFSFSLWFYVLNSEPLEVEMKLPLVLIPPKGMAISDIPTTEALVKIKGARVFVRNLFESDEKIFIDLARRGKKFKKGMTVKILPSDFPLPLGVEVTEIQPHRLEVKLEKQRSKVIKIKPFLVGEVSPELELLKYELVPSVLKLSGPGSVLNTLTDLETAPIELDKLKGDGRVKVLLKDIDPRLKAEDSLKEAEFLYRIKPKKANFTLKDVNIRFLTSSSGFVSKIKTATLDVLLPEGKEVSASDVKVVAEIPDGSKGEVRIKLEAELPEGVHLLQIYPETINVSL